MLVGAVLRAVFGPHVGRLLPLGSVGQKLLASAAGADDTVFQSVAQLVHDRVGVWRVRGDENERRGSISQVLLTGTAAVRCVLDDRAAHVAPVHHPRQPAGRLLHVELCLGVGCLTPLCHRVFQLARTWRGEQFHYLGVGGTLRRRGRVLGFQVAVAQGFKLRSAHAVAQCLLVREQRSGHLVPAPGRGTWRGVTFADCQNLRVDVLRVAVPLDCFLHGTIRCVASFTYCPTLLAGGVDAAALPRGTEYVRSRLALEGVGGVHRTSTGWGSVLHGVCSSRGGMLVTCPVWCMRERTSAAWRCRLAALSCASITSCTFLAMAWCGYF